MMRRIAVVGDKLERGGEILPYNGPVFTWGDGGHQSARIGGEAFYAEFQACTARYKTDGAQNIALYLGHRGR